MRFTVRMNRDALLAFSKDDLIALTLAQQAQIEALGARIAELEARLNAPPKTPDNSSMPPSAGQKHEPSGSPQETPLRSPRHHPRAGRAPRLRHRRDAGGLSALRARSWPGRPTRPPRL